MATEPLEIFKPGTFESMEGQTLNFTAEDVAATVAAYDPALHKAPFVIGHPKTDDPAYGWAASLSLSDDGVVLAEPEQVHAEFAEGVNNGNYPKISTSFWPPEHSANPVPGVWYPRHIGFLGGAAPAVKGLRPASFSSDDDGVVTVSFSETLQPNLERDMSTNKNLDKDKQKEASFAERETALAAREAEIAAREAKVAEQARAAKTAEIASFAEGLVSEGKLLPAEKEGVVSLLQGMAEEQVVSFAEGAGTVEKSGPEFLREFLTALPERVDFAERSAPVDEQAVTASFAAPRGYTVDGSQVELHNKITAYAEKHSVTYAQAAQAVGG